MIGERERWWEGLWSQIERTPEQGNMETCTKEIPSKKLQERDEALYK